MFESKQIFLKSLEESDLENRVKWVNDPEIRPYLMFDYPLSISKTRKWYHQTLFDNTKLNFSIFDKETKQHIGMTGLIDIDIKNRKAQFYITIGDKNFWGKKIPNEVIPMVLKYGFTELNLNKIYLYTLENNDRARHIYENNGFNYDGKLRQHYLCVGKLQDLFVHSILRSEWKEK